MVWKKSSERKTLFVQSWVWVDEDDLSLVNCEGGGLRQREENNKGEERGRRKGERKERV